MIKNLSTQNFFVYFYVPLIVGILVILKAFYIPNCWGFDAMDAVSLTFPNLAIAHSILADGHIPMMNIFNNFGTPLIGDGFTFPFSPLSWTYFTLPAPIAMTANRSLVGFLTMLCLTIYFRQKFSAMVASLCAFLVFFTPASLWSLPSHHYQLTVLWTCLIFLLQEKFSEKGSRQIYLMIYCASIFIFLSTNFQLAVTLFLYSFVHQLFLTKKDGAQRTLLFFAAVLSAFIFISPEPLSFLSNMSSSQRFYNYYDMGMTPSRTFISIIGNIQKLPGDDPPWHETHVYLSIPLIAITFLGICLFNKERKLRLFWESLILGVLPTAMVIVLILIPQLHWSLPYIRSSDITRFLWFSSFFIVSAAGYGLESFYRHAWNAREMFTFSFLFLFLMAIAFFLIPWRSITLASQVSLFPFITSLLIIFILLISKKYKKCP